MPSGVEGAAASQHRAVLAWPGRNSGGVSTRQRSKAFAHRGAKEQPRGSAAKSGGWPSIAVNRWTLSLIRGIELRSASVYGWAGALKICETGPDSTTRPAYITANWSHIFAT